MIGANTVQMDWIQLGPWTSPDEKGFGLAPQFVESIVGYGCMVDIATGRRFFKETGNRKERADAIIAIGHPALIYASERNVKAQTPKAMKQETFDAALKQGVIRKFDTLEEMAAYYKIPADALKAQNERMNDFLKARRMMISAACSLRIPCRMIKGRSIRLGYGRAFITQWAASKSTIERRSTTPVIASFLDCMQPVKLPGVSMGKFASER